jgi:uncharacterized membrane protein
MGNRSFAKTFSMNEERSLIRRIIGYFLQGLLFITPVFVTFYIIFSLFKFVDGLIPFDIPGLGLLVLLVGITLLGLLGNTIFAQPVYDYFQKLLDRAPLIKTIYNAVSDLMSAFVGKKKTFTQPVMVRLSQEYDLEKPGFITAEDLSLLGVGDDKVAVYLPHSYAWSGNVFIVPKKNVRPVDVKASDYMKFIVSAGVSNVGEHQEEDKDA